MSEDRLQRQTVLRPQKDKDLGAFPTVPVLVLGPRRQGQVAVIPISRNPLHPKWLNKKHIESLLDANLIEAKPFEQPRSALLPVEKLPQKTQANYSRRQQAFKGLAESADADLLEYPDEFSRVCAKYARHRKIGRKWVEKMACDWLKNGRTTSALVSNLINCGGPDKKRNFTNAVPGPRQTDGEQYDVLAASPYSRDDRELLQQEAEMLYHDFSRSCTNDELWMKLRERLKTLLPGVPPPSPEQLRYLLEDMRERERRTNSNLRPLPASMVPREFLETGRPALRVELFKWSLERNREIIKPIPSVEALNAIVLPTEYCTIHAGKGIFKNKLYYSCDDLAASGLLKRRSGRAPLRVEVAQHRGTNRFVFWVRGPHDYVRCELKAADAVVLADMTVQEAKEHLKSTPSVKKRARVQMVQRQAHLRTHGAPNERRAKSEAAQKGHLTRDKQRIQEFKERDIALNAAREAHRRFPDQVPAPDPATRWALPASPAQEFNDEQAAHIAALIAERQKS